MFHNSKRIRSEVFTVEIQECLDFLGSSIPFLASGYQGPGFHFEKSCGLSADSLTRAGGNQALLSIYTALSWHKCIFCWLEERARGPQVFKPPGVCFCSEGHYLFRLLKKLECSPLVKGTGGCRCYDSGTAPMCWSFSPACCTCEWIFKFHLKSCLPLCNEVPPQWRPGGASFQPRGSQSVVSDQQQQGILELVSNADS